MIGVLRETVRTRERQSYTAAMAGLWGDLSGVLSRLDSIAAHPDDALASDAVLETLPALQYALHRASELAHGIEPPPEAEVAHRELAYALADARDATAEIGEVAANGGTDAAEALVPEWRGALFRVRLAQMRLAQPRRRPPQPRIEPDRFENRAAVVATALVLAGTFLVTCGAVVGVWLLWASGLVLAGASFFVYRP
jgi:hypothetical protein